MSDDILPSWRPGVAREAVVTFLEATEAVARDQRVACFDCESLNHHQAA